MPKKAKEIENTGKEIGLCPVCGTKTLNSGYCPKCKRKSDGTVISHHGRHDKRTPSGKFAKKDEEAPPEAPPITAQDFSLKPETEDDYLCEGCRAKVAFLQRKCKKCGIYLDWRGTEAETDADVIICPQCGAFCGYAEDNPGVCPHCHFRG